MRTDEPVGAREVAILLSLNLIPIFMISSFTLVCFGVHGRTFTDGIAESCRGRVRSRFQKRSGEHPLAFEIRPYGRFGNNLMQLTNTLQLCRYVDVHIVFISPGFVFIEHNFATTENVHVFVKNPADARPGTAVFANNFYMVTTVDRCMNWDIKSVAATFREHVLRPFANISAHPAALYVHVRFCENHGYYGQPPCSFYVDSIPLANVTKVIVVSQDESNPCVQTLLRHSKEFLKTDLRATLGTLFDARFFVLARSTMSFAVLLLSRWAENGTFFTYGYPWADIGAHWNCKPTAAYQAHVLETWSNLHSQYELMLHDRCDGWTYINNKLDFYPYHYRDSTLFR
jgi:hypothetical protein